MYKYILILLSTFLFAGCASNPMQQAAQQQIQPVEANQAQVIFMRSSVFGGAIKASLFDVTDGNIQFIGILANNTKTAYVTKPGKHTFMVVSESADFMEANLKAGSNYFSLATPRLGMWKSRFSLWPIKHDKNAHYHFEQPRFQEWLEETKLVVNSPKSQAWFNTHKNSVESKYNKYWPEWQKKSAADLAKRTLMPQDAQ